MGTTNAQTRRGPLRGVAGAAGAAVLLRRDAAHGQTQTRVSPGGVNRNSAPSAMDIIHPDPLTAGGIRETKRIADYASLHGIPTAVHFAGSPVGCMACVHMAATIKDFVALENHAVDIPWWGDLVTGVAKPIIQNGYIPVPDTPGLGIELNEDVVKQHLRVPGYFEPTPQFDNFILDDFRIGGPYPHLDEFGNPVVSQ